MPTGFGPADSGVLDGADGDLEHRNKITSLFWNDRMNYLSGKVSINDSERGFNW